MKETGNSRYIYQNDLDKACFQHDIAHGDFNDLTRRTASDKISRGKAFDITKNLKYDGYQWSINFLIKKLLAVVLKMRIFQTKNWPTIYPNQLLKVLKKKSTLIFYRQYLGC